MAPGAKGWCGMEAAVERGQGEARNSESARGWEIQRLREQIRKLKGAPRRSASVLATGIPSVDALFPMGGLPMGTVVELWGEAASGRTSLALRALAAVGRQRGLSAYVDGPRELYPPAAEVLGVDLSRLLIVRAPTVRALRPVWTAVQLCRSGAFSCVVLDLTRTGVRLAAPEAKKLADAVFRSATLLLLLTPTEAPGGGMLRLATRPWGLQGLSVEIQRSSRGGMGQKALVPWAQLYEAGEPSYRYAAAWPTSEVTRGTELALWPQPHQAPFRRPKPGLERNGCGLYATRPGRDVSMPPLAPSLGL